MRRLVIGLAFAAASLLSAEAGICREGCHAWLDVNTNLFAKQGADEITAKEIEETGGMPIYAFSLLWGRLNPSYAF